MPSGASFITAKCVPHCSPLTVAGPGASSVLVNGKPAARAGDKVTPHLKPAGRKCKPHAPAISKGSTSVIVEGKPFARIGDTIAGCTAIAQGSPDVIVGG